MKSELKKRKTAFNIAVGVYLIIFSVIASTIFGFGYLFNRLMNVEDYCREIVHEELAKDVNHPEWVNPPSWYNGSAKDKMGYEYFKQLECSRKLGLFGNIPQK